MHPIAEEEQEAKEDYILLRRNKMLKRTVSCFLQQIHSCRVIFVFCILLFFLTIIIKLPFLRQSLIIWSSLLDLSFLSAKIVYACMCVRGLGERKRNHAQFCLYLNFKRIHSIVCCFKTTVFKNQKDVVIDNSKGVGSWAPHTPLARI